MTDGAKWMLPPDLVPPSAPSLSSNFDADSDRLRPLNRNLTDLEWSSRQFSADGALFNYCSRQEVGPFSLWRDWIFLAQRDCVMVARNFGVALTAVQSRTLEVDAWTDAIARTAFSIPLRRFRAAFPNIGDLRNAVAHPEEYSKPDPHTSVVGKAVHLGFVNMPAESNRGITLQSNVFGPTISSSFKGRVASCDLSLENARELVAITKLCFAVFDSVQHHSQEKLFF